MRVSALSAIVLFLSSSCVMPPPVQKETAPSGPPPTFAEARTALRASLGEVARGRWPGVVASSTFRSQEPIEEIEIGADRFSFMDRGVLAPAQSDTGKDKPYSGRRVFVFRENSSPSMSTTSGFGREARWFVHLNGTPIPGGRDSRPNDHALAFTSEAAALRMIQALSDIARSTSGEALADDESAFATRAAAWRALAEKPAMPEDARREKVLAENYFREKSLEAAAEHYRKALAIFPMWPEGNFNLGLLDEQTQDYPDAIRYMKRYLLLAPDAKDAQAARDKIFFWEDKLRAHP